MIETRVIWTTLPNGIDDEKRLRLSVHVAPRLTTDDGDPAPRRLDEYGPFEVWPDRLGHLRWRVEFDNGVTAEGIPADKTDADLWKRLFPGDTFVRPHAFVDHAKQSLHSFPVRDVLSFLESTYGSLSAAGPALPSIDGPNPLTAAFGPLAGLTDQITDSSSFWDEFSRAQQAIKDPHERPDGRVVRDTPSSSSGAANSLFEAYRFYYRPGDQRPEFDPGFDPKYVEPPPKPPDLDFHDLVGLLADHPRLLRRLGLVVDLVVDLADPQGQLPSVGSVRVVPDGDLPESPARTPWTRYDLEDRWFGARPAQPFLLERGLVRLTREFWDLFQVDVDGGALQSVGFGSTLARLQDPDRRNEATPDETGAPALRSGGFSLARQRRADALLMALKHHRDLNDDIELGSTVTFHLEDLVRGYRVDVFDEDAPGGKRWFSLHDRITTHTVGLPGAGEPMTLEPIRDEGFIKSTAASSEREDHPNPSDDLYLHDTVASWDGWSLAAPRPGKRIVEPGEGENGGASPLARHDPTEGQLRPLVSVTTAAPKSLPRLRLGHTYRLRLRTVDLAGNAVPFSEDELAPLDSELASEAERYVRFEPVPSPVVLRRHVDTEGESLEHLVIRSNGGISAKDYAVSPPVVAALAEVAADHAYAEDSQRHVAPPKGSMQMAEFDSRLEAAMGGTNAQMNSALRTALREEGTFLDPKIVDPTTGRKTIDQSTIALHPAGASLPATRGGGLSSGQADFDQKLAGAYAFHPDDAVVLPYLPDPLAVGISVVGYDHDGSEVLSMTRAFPGNWPKLAPFRIRLSEAATPTPTIAFSAGVVEVALPKAFVVRAQLSSIFPDGRLADLAIWAWTPEADRTASLEKAAVAGRHWMLTPWRWLTFTHAVQRPLAVPDSAALTVGRGLGQTFATFDGSVKNHARSTGRLDVFGEWTEDVDLVTDTLPRYARAGTAVPHTAQAFGFDLGPGEDSADVTMGSRVSRHEFGDTKHRRIVYHSIATTRFREYLPRPIADDPDAIQQREAYRDASDAWLPALIRDVPSSARPATPDVVQTLPTFRWERSDDGPVRTHARHGKAIRVWLRRPWFSSGDGEQLGVVLEPAIRLPRGWASRNDVLDAVRSGSIAVSSKAPKREAGPRPRRAAGTVDTAIVSPDRVIAAQPKLVAASKVSAELLAGPTAGKKIGIKLPGPSTEEIHRMLRPYVTQWGSDPVWASRLPLLPPTTADFPLRISARSGLTLEELAPQAKVSVAGHEVYFDADRGLWYSDIEIDNGDAYYPFVRLALARYQPSSVDGAHLSRVSVTDFMQVVPDRTAEVALGSDAATVTIRGYGGENILARMWQAKFPDIVLGSDLPAPNTSMRAVVERRPADLPGDLGWSPVGPEVSLDPDADGFHVTWSGSVAIPPPVAGEDRRIMITEIETYLRDMLPDDPPMMVSPADFVRERIVYADSFEL